MGGKAKNTSMKKFGIVSVVIILFVLILLFTLSVIFKEGKATGSIMGQRFFITETSDMEPAISEKSLIMAKNKTLNADNIGCVLLCEGVSDNQATLYRLVDVQTTTDTLIYRVCHDSTPNDVISISASNVIGEATYAFPTAGKLLLFVLSTEGTVICIVIPVFILSIILLCMTLVRKTKAINLQKKREERAKERELARTGKTKEEYNGVDGISPIASNVPITIEEFMHGGKTSDSPIKKPSDIVNSSNRHGNKTKHKTNSQRKNEKTIVYSGDVPNPEEVRKTKITDDSFKSFEEKAPQKTSDELTQVIKEVEADKPWNAPIEEKTEAVEKLETETTEVSAEKTEKASEAVSEPSTSKAKISFEELIKLMDEQEKKLKDSIDK